MIRLKRKADCCGCTACVEKCPEQCISLIEDQEGFLYPEVNSNVCIDCGLCEKVCPVINQKEERLPLKVYAVQNKDERIRLNSSSGGVFTMLAEQVIREQGVVFGARFDENWDVIHDYTETIEGLAHFRKSKYVQSRIGQTYRKASDFLRQGRKVLFSGTPCQIAGLKMFLKKEYGNLLTVDFICHGVPSPKVWRMYLDEAIARQFKEKNTVLTHSIQRNKVIRSINFRSKSTGWKEYSFALTLSETTVEGEKNTVLLSSLLSENIFMRGFLANLYLRPSCHECPVRHLKSGSDITLADFWGVWDVFPVMYDDKGTSLLTLNTSKGMEEFNHISTHCEILETDVEVISKYNTAFYTSVAPHSKRTGFFKLMDQSKSMDKLINGCLKITFMQKVKNKLHRILTK